MFRFSPNPNRAHLINWREWGPEPFEDAQRQDKLLMLFLGAFWCGFCQRMDETTLSNDENIALLNAYFIPVRVENAQRPDVDVRYNQNGWPTIAFMTPQGDHLASVNYLPPADFGNVLVRLYQLYEEQKEEVQNSVAHANQQASQSVGSNSYGRLRTSVVSEISNVLMKLADPVNGGYGPDHKFPHPEANEFLLYRQETTGEASYLEHVMLTLNRMTNSETHDDMDGGFFRYSSKSDWSEPHQEKLLEDHAGILRNCLHTYLLTERDEYRQLADEILTYLNTHLSGPSGAFYGCQDYLRVTAFNIDSLNDPALKQGDFFSIVDDWIYTDSNAQTASALLEASWVLGRPDCKKRALGVLEFLWERCRSDGGEMCHYFNGEPHAPGLLIDQVYMGTALLDAYRFTGDAKYLSRASELGQYVIGNHTNPEGGYYDTSRKGPGHLRYPLTLLVQNGLAASFFLGICDTTEDSSYRRAALWALSAFTGDFAPYGVYASQYGLALARYMSEPVSVTLLTGKADPNVRPLAAAALRKLAHYRLTMNVRESLNGTTDASDRAALYIENGADRIGPVYDADDITPALASVHQSS